MTDHFFSAARSCAARRVLDLAWRCVGAAVGVSVALWFVAPPHAPFLLASLGGSAVFVFGLNDSPAAQPRALFVGHLSCAAAGVACVQLFGVGLWVEALALGLGLAFMMSARVMHPPAGANALLMVHAGAGWIHLLQPVLLGVSCLALMAAAWSRCRRSGERYPLAWWPASPPPAAD